MGIRLARVRLKNYKSFKSSEIELGDTTILIGKNNSGKSNLLSAVSLAFSTDRLADEDDIFMTHGETAVKNRTASIDIMLRPTDAKGDLCDEFARFWRLRFGIDYIRTDAGKESQYVAFRTTIQYDEDSDAYVVERYILRTWGDTAEEAETGKVFYMQRDARESLAALYVDAHRDITSDIRQKNSYFSRATAASGFDDDFVDRVEEELAEINRDLVNNSDALTQTTKQLSQIGGAVGSAGARVEIEPLAGHIADLHKGIDIFYSEDNSARLPISQQGMGTKSWIAFLTLSAFVNFNTERIRKAKPNAEAQYILLMEEPEAHLHPQAQKQIFSQLTQFTGQRIISTHSASIAAQANLNDLVFVTKVNGESVLKRVIDKTFDSAAKEKIRREVLRSRGDIFFSNGVILCEGITEEMTLPIYYEQVSGTSMVAHGINVAAVGGQGYLPFIRLLTTLGIPWFVFSDGEPKPVKAVSKAVKTVCDKNLSDLTNVVVLDNGYDYEKYLVYGGFWREVETALNTYHNDDHYVDKYIKKSDGQSRKRVKTDEICETCHQFIYKDVKRDYTGDEGHLSAIYDCCICNKAEHAVPVAMQIVSTGKVPDKIITLFSNVDKVLGITELRG